MITPKFISMTLAVLFVLGVIHIYNKLVKLRNKPKGAFSQIDAQLKRRYDIIPSLLDLARRNIPEESKVIEKLNAAKNQAVTANVVAAVDPGNREAMGILLAAESKLGAALAQFFAATENHKNFRDQKDMIALHEKLVASENKIQIAKQKFNECVEKYNSTRLVFPSSIVSKLFGFREAGLFDIAGSEGSDPKLSESD